MALDAHPTKTVQVVIGHKRSIEQLKDDIKLDPTKVQGHNIEIKKEEKYLGQFVPEGGKKQYIERNIEAKMARIIVTSNEIRNILRHPIMSRFGKVLAQKTLIVSQIIPLITYGCQSWLYPNKGQIKMLEKILKKSLEIVLSLPANTNYEAMLNQMGLTHIESTINALKLKYFQNKIHVKKRGVLYRILREEFLFDIPGGFSEEISQLCQRYKIPDINLQYV